MDEFPGNSHLGKKEVAQTIGSEAIDPKKIEKVVTGEVHQRKKPVGKRFLETFFGGTAKGAATYVVMDVVLPAVKDVIFDAFSTGIERILFGEGRGGNRRTIGRPSGPVSGRNGYVSYNQFSSGPPGGRREREEPRSLSRKARSNHDFEEIVLGSRAEANAVLERMFDIIEKYDVCSISDLYKLVGIAPQFTDEHWGWKDIHDARPVRAGSAGYVLDLPKPEYIEQ